MAGLARPFAFPDAPLPKVDVRDMSGHHEWCHHAADIPRSRHRRGRHRDRLCPRLRPGRAERQQGLDLGPTALRHAQADHPGGCGDPARPHRRPAHDQGRRDRDPGAALPHPGAQPAGRHRPARRDPERGDDAAIAAACDTADLCLQAAPARRQEASQRRQVRSADAVSTTRDTAVDHVRRIARIAFCSRSKQPATTTACFAPPRVCAR